MLKKSYLWKPPASPSTVPVVQVGFELKLNYLDRFSKKYSRINFYKNPPVETELFLRRNGRTDMTKKIVKKKNINPDTYSVLIPFQIFTVK